MRTPQKLVEKCTALVSRRTQNTEHIFCFTYNIIHLIMENYASQAWKTEHDGKKRYTVYA